METLDSASHIYEVAAFVRELDGARNDLDAFGLRDRVWNRD